MLLALVGCVTVNTAHRSEGVLQEVWLLEFENWVTFSLLIFASYTGVSEPRIDVLAF